MTITWTNCLERMPPDDCQDVLLVQRRLSGLKAMRTHGIICKVNADFLKNEDIQWTPYTEEAWSELTR